MNVSGDVAFDGASDEPRADRFDVDGLAAPPEFYNTQIDEMPLNVA